MATIIFEDYNIEKLIYNKNINFDMDNTEQYEITSEMEATIAVKNEYGIVLRNCEVSEK